MTEWQINAPSVTRKSSPALRGWWTSALLIFALLLPGISPAQDASVRSGAPESYVVKEGDTLWGIADMFLEQPWLWPEVWDVNPQIDNPHLIFPGDTLYLSYVDGRPRLSLTRGRDVKLTPNMRVTPLDLAIPVIPLDDVDAFLKRHRIIGPEELESSSYVVAGGKEHLITANGDTIYGRGYFPEDERAYGIFRAGDVYRDPITLEVLGYQAQDIGNAQAKSSLSDPVVELEVTRVTEEVRITDRLLPLDERILDATFQPRAPDVDVEDAFMIAVDGGVTQIGTLDIVVLNRGAREGMQVGHVLAIYQTGAVVFDEVAQSNVSLPDVRAGLAMVFEVAEKASYALVLKSNRPLKVMDKVKNP
ncbi:LysM peptidoglycan-binding domain-containing protein [Congregibacter sp.]|uniref:LysM peptidoglycan-binding domain-containing protein n=1 Tax=Congregibacter sp. TaxID=2744308 RepID=UPI003F6CF0FD